VATPLSADPGATNAARLEQAKEQLTTPKYQLRYAFQPGQTLRYRVEHLATVDTTIRGTLQTTKSRSVSTKAWTVKELRDDETVVFTHQVEDVDMWSQVSGRQPVQYNSRDGGPVPPEYAAVAQSIGVPLTTVTMDARGRVVQREDAQPHINLGISDLALPLPEGEVPLGYSWATPYDLQVRLKDGRLKSIKTRQLFKLEQVETGVATISIRTQVLTPVDDPAVRAQLVQRLSEGEVKFDLDAGRVISRRLDWDEAVIGFNGADSNMKYLARFTETFVSAADAPDSAVEQASLQRSPPGPAPAAVPRLPAAGQPGSRPMLRR